MTKYINPGNELKKIIPIAMEKACFSVEISKQKLEEYDEKINRIVKAARNFKRNYEHDSNYLEERMKNGFLAQAALEDYFGVDITGDNFEEPDRSADLKLCGLNIGIKTSKAKQNNAPLIPDIVKNPEIIMLIDPNNKYLYHCLGVFSVKILSNPYYRCKSLVKDKNAAYLKTGFFRLDVGYPFKTLNELKKAVSPFWLI